MQIFKKKLFQPQRLYVPASEKALASRHCRRRKEEVCAVVLTDLLAAQESLSIRRKHLASCRISLFRPSRKENSTYGFH